MDLVTTIPRHRYDELRKAFLAACRDRDSLDMKTFKRVLLPFVDPSADVASLDRPGGASSSAARRLQAVFHHVDFKDKKLITWEDFSMYLVDSITRTADAAARLDCYDVGHVEKHDPIGRTRIISYVKEWDRCVRATSFHGQNEIELCHPATLHTIATGPSQKVVVNTLETLPKHNLVVTANADLTCSMYGVALSGVTSRATKITLEHVYARQEIDDPFMTFKWHGQASKLLGGTQSGAVRIWDEFDRVHVEDRFKPGRNVIPVHDAPLTSLLELSRDVVVTTSLDRTVSTVNLVKEQVVDRFSGHNQGILCAAQSDFANLVVTGGFESAIYAWILTLHDKVKPWKLFDKSNPHRGDVNYLYCPSGAPQVISADSKGVVKIWDIRNFQCLQTLQPDRFFAAVDVAGASVMATLLVPTAHRKTDPMAVSVKNDASSGGGGDMRQPFSATFNTASKTVILNGSRATYFIASDQPLHLSTADDHPITCAVHNLEYRGFVTSHNRTVKIWDDNTGAVVMRHVDVAPSEITSLCIDNTGRKFFVGTRAGGVAGHIFHTGRQYRVFQEKGEAIVSLAYHVVRSNRRLLLAVCCHEVFLCFEEGDQDVKTIVVSQPVYVINAVLRVAPPKAYERSTRSSIIDENENDEMMIASCVMSVADMQALLIAEQTMDSSATQSPSTEGLITPRRVPALAPHEKPSELLNQLPAAGKFDFSLLVMQPKLSLMYIAVRNVVAVVDTSLLVVVHVFQFALDVVAVTPLGELPVFAAVDTANTLFLYTVRPCRASEKLLVMYSLQTEPDDAVSRHIVSSLAYHANTMVLFVGDNLGHITTWNLKPVIRQCNLTPMTFPSMCLSSTVLRKKVVFPTVRTLNRLITRIVAPMQIHDDEVNNTLLVSTNGKVALMTTCWGDHRVRLWSRDLETLGELSQGRIHNVERADPEMVALHYRRHGIQPFRLPQLTEEQHDVEIEDLPEIVVFLLRKACRRYRRRKDLQRQRSVRVGVAASAAQRQQSLAIINATHSSGAALRRNQSMVRSVQLPAEIASESESEADEATEKQIRDKSKKKHTSFAKWTVAKNLDMPTEQVTAVVAPESTTIFDGDDDGDIGFASLTAGLGGSSSLRERGPLKPAAVRPHARLRSGQQVAIASTTMNTLATAPVPGTKAYQRLRPDVTELLTPSSKLVQEQKDRAQHERYVAEKFHVHEECLINVHRAVASYVEVKAVTAALGRNTKGILEASVRPTGVPQLPLLPPSVTNSASRGPQTARGVTVPHKAPVSTREAEMNAAKALFDSDFEYDSRSVATSRASKGRESDAYSTSRYNTGSYTPMYRIDSRAM